VCETSPRPLSLFPTIQHHRCCLPDACPWPCCRCQEAIDAFSRLPAHHYQTGWVLCCVGRAFFEMVDYPEAAKAFSWARQVKRWGRYGRWVGGTGRRDREMGLGYGAGFAVWEQQQQQQMYVWRSPEIGGAALFRCPMSGSYAVLSIPTCLPARLTCRQVDPYRMRGLEVYSTVLWHCKREVELASLAQEASALDRQSPYAWCVLGNCFSLQKVSQGGGREVRVEWCNGCRAPHQQCRHQSQCMALQSALLTTNSPLPPPPPTSPTAGARDGAALLPASPAAGPHPALRLHPGGARVLCQRGL
jgi:hypothetical protein